MVRQIALLAFAMLVATNWAAVVSSGSNAFLANGEGLRPDVVANTLVSVEDEWRKQAAVFTAENAPTARGTPASFAKSCATVVSAVIQGSGGDRAVAKEYMSNVCGQKVLEGWHKLRCTSLATAITDKAMHADNYANRQMNPTKVCASFWSIFVEAEKNREAEEAKLRAEQEKIRAEEEKKAAAAKAEADKKAAAEAKAEAERRAKVQAEHEAEQAKVNAKRDAEEAKARAAEAKARHEQLKAEAEKVQKEAQQKLEEAEKAEKEHQARLAEHQKAEELLHDAAKSAPKPEKGASDPAPKPTAVGVTEKVAASAPKPAAKPVSEAKVVTAPAKVDATAKSEPAVPAKAVETPQKNAAKVVAVAKPAFLEQDPCAGCDTALAQAYQTCASKHGNPCAETNEAGLVTSGPGAKKDIGCCMKKEKHDRCLQCSSMDCAHKTCNVNKKYYSTYTIVDKLDDKKAMKKSGWGL